VIANAPDGAAIRMIRPSSILKIDWANEASEGRESFSWAVLKEETWDAVLPDVRIGWVE